MSIRSWIFNGEKKNKYAVSELVGVIILLAIVTSVMALVFYQVILR